jgi:putative transposase
MAAADFIRQPLQHTLQRLMQLDVVGCRRFAKPAYGQRSDGHIKSGNGCHDRAYETTNRQSRSEDRKSAQWQYFPRLSGEWSAQ